MISDRIVRLSLITVAILAMHPLANAATIYRAVDLGDLPGGNDHTEALAINNSGQVVGGSSSAAGSRAFLWDRDNGLKDLGTLNDSPYGSFATDINAQGQVVGTAGQRPFLWDSVNGMRDLGVLDLGQAPSEGYVGLANDINDAGQVVGYSGGDYLHHATLWDPTTGLQDLGDLPGGLNRSRAFLIGDDGRVFGTGNVTGDAHPFVWTAVDGMQDLAGVFAPYSSQTAINSTGQIVGHGNDGRAYIWDSVSGFHDLGDLPGGASFSAAFDINELGQVVGASQVTGGAGEGGVNQHAFLWDSAHGMQDLNTMVESIEAEWTLVNSYALNDVGQIACIAIKSVPGSDDIVHSFLLTPVPEPTGLIAILCCCGLLGRRLLRPSFARRGTRCAALAAMLVMALTESSAHAALTDSLIGYWPFNGNGTDASGGGREMTLYGNAGFASGLFGEALDLHPNNFQYAGRPIDDAIFDFGVGDFTVQIWVNYNTITREQNLIEKFQGGGATPGWTLTSLLNGGSSVGQVHFWTSEGQLALYSESLPDVQAGTWRQVVARREGTTFDLIYDGEIVDTGASALPVSDTDFPLIIGRRNFFDGRDFWVDGRLDEAAIWNRALTDDEVAFLYNGGAGNPVAVPEPAGVVIAVVVACSAVCRRRHCASLVRR